MTELFEKLRGFAQFMDFECQVASWKPHAMMVKSVLRYRRAVCTNGYSRGRRHESRYMRHLFKVILIEPTACQISPRVMCTDMR